MTAQRLQFLLFIGTYTTGSSEGIYVYQFDASTGTMEHLSTMGGVKNPTFLALGPSARNLYSVGAVSDESGQPAGAVHAFSIDQATGALAELNHQPSMGVGPCHLSVDHTGRYVLVANYGSGSVAMLPIRGDGSVGEATGFSQHEGSSVNRDRQEGPAGGAARPFDRCGPGQPVCLRARSGAGQGDGLPA